MTCSSSMTSLSLNIQRYSVTISISKVSLESEKIKLLFESSNCESYHCIICVHIVEFTRRLFFYSCCLISVSFREEHGKTHVGKKVCLIFLSGKFNRRSTEYFIHVQMKLTFLADSILGHQLPLRRNFNALDKIVNLPKKNACDLSQVTGGWLHFHIQEQISHRPLPSLLPSSFTPAKRGLASPRMFNYTSQV